MNNGRGNRFTLPKSIGFYRNTSLDKPVKTKQRGLQSTVQRTCDYGLDLVCKGQLLAEVLLEVAALLTAQVREFGVGYVIFL